MRFMFIVLIFVLFCYQCDIFNTTFATFVPLTDYQNSLQVYSFYFSDVVGDSMASLQYGAGQQLFFACLSAVDTNHNTLSIVGQAPFNYSLGIPTNSSVIAPNGLQFFKTATSFGFGANESLTNCSNASGSNVLCFNINATSGNLGPGGFCGSEGYQQQNSVILFIFSAPCLNSTIGSPCQIPGYNLCAQNATCQANYLCNGTATFTQPPTPLSNSCWVPTTCDISTGIYNIRNTSANIPCSNGHSCIIGERCDGAQNCVGGNPLCSTNNTCLGPTYYCNQTSNWTCVFDTVQFQGKPCTFIGGFACRNTDTCDAGICVQGSPRPPPAIDTACTYNNVTCNNATGQYDKWYYANGTICQPTDQCITAQCLSGGCTANPVNKNSTLGEISNCQVAQCNSTNGEWYTIGKQNPGITCKYPNVSAQSICDVGVCDADDNCVLQGPYTCPFDPQTPCVTYQCNASLTLATRCQPIPVDGIPCKINSCQTNGNCSAGLCVNTTIQTCSNINVFDPQCGVPTCDNSTGCFLLTFSSNVSCNAPCYVNGTAHCSYGSCVNGAYSCFSSFATPFSSLYPFFL